MRLSCALLIFLLVAAASGREERKDQYAVMVYDRQCIDLANDARYEAPMVDGKPDLPHGQVIGLVVHKPETCGHYEVRRFK